MLPPYLNQDSNAVARQLLGSHLIRRLNHQEVRVRIVETESYDQFDAASHSYSGQTPRTSVMFGPSGHLYVYFTYGMHYCCNIVCGPTGVGAAVLIRAIEPIQGLEAMLAHRPKSGPEISNGPAKLCQALSIDKQLNGHPLTQPPLQLLVGESIADDQVIQTTRIGIRHAKDELRRFYIKDNPYVSRP